MDSLIALLFSGLFLLFIAYFLFDVNYFIRWLYTVIIGKCFRPKMVIIESSVKYGIVFFTDADHYLTHMNNARCLREFDFGRMDYFIRTGLYKYICAMKGGGVVAAQTIRYRRPLHMFSAYKIVSTPVYYDTKSIYFEQKLVTLSDSITRCVGYIKLTFNTSFNVEKVISKYYPATIKPRISRDLERWMEFNELSSERMKSRRSSRKSTNTVETTALTEINEQA